MPRPFSSATAEQVVAAVEAVVVNQQPTTAEFVANFYDLTRDQAESALKLATDIGLLSHNAGTYSVNNPLCRFVTTTNQMQKAAVIRVLLESYQPFIFFRERLIATDAAVTAAQQTKVAFDLDAHRESVKDTLINLGTYGHALVTQGGGHYTPEYKPFEDTLGILIAACEDMAAAEAKIREMLGSDVVLTSSNRDVIVPLADALLRAKGGDSRGAIVQAGNAVESYLNERGVRMSVNLSGATGINAKIDRFASATTNRLPKKLVNVGKYLGHIRNAADHGTDTDIGAAWNIRPTTGLEYLNVACSFLAASMVSERGGPPEI